VAIITHDICHLFEIEAYRKVRVVQDKRLAEIQGTVYLSCFERQDKVDRML
jgi:hypothetical protein